jgi:hypothetical protein
VYYNSHSTCEGITRPVSPEAAQMSPNTADYMSPEAQQNIAAQQQAAPQQTAPAAQGSGTYTPSPPPPTTNSSYQYGEPGYQQSQEAAVSPTNTGYMPPPSSYDQGYETNQTYQIVKDEQGRQYEVMTDGSLMLVYDPAW